MRLVVDINILIRALRSPGPARLFFREAPLHHDILWHPSQISELRDVAARPRLRLSPEETEALIDRILHYGEPIVADLEPTGDCRDPKDEYLLAMALVGRADHILSEDLDLLALDPWRGIRVLRLFQFLRDHPLPQ